MLKLYAWEPSFEDRLNEIRKDELSVLRKAGILNAVNLAISYSSPFLVSPLAPTIHTYVCQTSFLVSMTILLSGFNLKGNVTVVSSKI